jgi:signal transduction histidine kinase
MLKEQYQKQVEQEVKNFRKSAKKIEESSDPRLAGRGVKEYEVNQLKESMEKRVAEFNREFHDKIEAQIEQASKEAARSKFFVSSADKQFVSDITDELSTKLTFAINEGDKRQAIREFEEKLEAFDKVDPFSEVVKQLADLNRKLGDDEFSKRKLGGLYRQLSAGLQTPEQETLESLKADKMSGVDMAFRRLQMVHPSYSYKHAARRTNRY